ncbi:MAG: restriction endonuclease [Myxococcota bacterium]|nr:restriction endonuclease [Myxococcota bacterium]
MPASSPDFLALVESILNEKGRPLPLREVARALLNQGHVSGLSLEALCEAIQARLLVEQRLQREADRFILLPTGRYGLRAWGASTAVFPAHKEGEDATHRPELRLHDFPTYGALRQLLPLIEGTRSSTLTLLLRQLRIQLSVDDDWSRPARWIDRLEPRARSLAASLWEQSGGQLNPAQLLPLIQLARRGELIEVDPEHRLRLTPRGGSFLEHPEGEVVQRLDQREGVTLLLELVATQGPCSAEALFSEWGRALRRLRRRRSEGQLRLSLRSRLRNLLERGHIERSGLKLMVTEFGLALLRGRGIEAPRPAERSLEEIWTLMRQQRQEVRAALTQQLATLDPFLFEALVGELLSAMGYQEIQLTQRRRDLGIDLVARIELGVSSVREVIQVKRERRRIQRPVLDALRGSLHRFNAVRGTLVNLGGFSGGTLSAAFEPGAAPITLIDGEKLIDLLMEYELGVRKRQLMIWQLEPLSLERRATQFALSPGGESSPKLPE